MLLTAGDFGAPCHDSLAELHGRCGYFPAHLRLWPKGGSIPPRCEAAEVLDLQAVRDTARLV